MCKAAVIQELYLKWTTEHVLMCPELPHSPRAFIDIWKQKKKAAN